MKRFSYPFYFRRFFWFYVIILPITFISNLAWNFHASGIEFYFRWDAFFVTCPLIFLYSLFVLRLWKFAIDDQALYVQHCFSFWTRRIALADIEKITFQPKDDFKDTLTIFLKKGEKKTYYRNVLTKEIDEAFLQELRDRSIRVERIIAGKLLKR